jgi:peptidoglycan-associated lipoprotein
VAHISWSEWNRIEGIPMRLIASLIICTLLPACSSQIVIVPASSDGTTTAVDVPSEKGIFTLSKQGYGFYTDHIWDAFYRVGDEDISRDFGPVLDAMRPILDEGLPELPHSYLVLLKHESGPLGSLSFKSANGGMYQLQLQAESIYIDGYPGGPINLDGRRLLHDFGPALAALRDTLKARRSYLMLLPSPDGEASKVIFRAGGAETMLENAGESLTLDGLPYEAEQELASNDFADSRDATRQILAAGLPIIPHSYAVLRESPLGPLGEVEVLEGPAMGVILNEDSQAVMIDGVSRKTFTLDQAKYQMNFGDAMAAMPLPPETLILYFESGSTRLTRDARAILPLILDEIRKRASVEITISGHTDTLSDGRSNERLSQQRGEMIASFIRQSHLQVNELSVEGFGETMLAVRTPDNRSEPLNRRVEVSIR